MKTFCLSCRKHADNIGSKKVIMTNKVIREKSKCANFVDKKSRFLKQKSNEKVIQIKLVLNFAYINYYKAC